MSYITRFFGWILQPLKPAFLWLLDHHEAIIDLIARSIGILREILKFVIKVAHWTGTVVMLALMAVSLLVVWHAVATELGWVSVAFPTLYEAFERLALNKALWAAVTMIVVTTVSIRHLWNYEVNYERFVSDLRERYKPEIEGFLARRR